VGEEHQPGGDTQQEEEEIAVGSKELFHRGVRITHVPQEPPWQSHTTSNFPNATNYFATKPFWKHRYRVDGL
jgi:hypothetical protein